MKNDENIYDPEELFGYRYDPVLKRYFKIGGEPLRQGAQSKQAKSQSTSVKRKKPEITVKYGNSMRSLSVSGIPRTLQLREMGFTKNPSFSSSLIKMKLRQFKASYNQKVSLNQEVVTCDYVQGHQNYLIGAWSVTDEVQDILIKGECVDFDSVGNEVNLDSYFSDENCVIATLHKRQVLRDMCIGDLDSDHLCVGYVSNDIDHKVYRSSAACLSVSRNVGSYDATLIYGHSYPSASESCAFGSAKKLFAVGLEKNVNMYTIFSSFPEVIGVPGRPFSLNFNPDNSMMYCGLHNGTFLGLDLREPRHNPAVYIKLAGGLIDFKLLRNETSLVVSAFSTLLNVDLRARRVVFKYPCHVNKYKRLLPLSYDETWNVLCSPGQDNVTRLWCLKDGKPLLSVQAPLGDLKNNLHKSWFHATPRGPLLHLWQGDSAYLYET